MNEKVLKVLAIDKVIQAQKNYTNECDYLLGWYQVISQTNFNCLDDLNKTFGKVIYNQSIYFLPIPKSNLMAKVFINFSANVALINEIISV